MAGRGVWFAVHGGAIAAAQNEHASDLGSSLISGVARRRRGRRGARGAGARGRPSTRVAQSFCTNFAFLFFRTQLAAGSYPQFCREIYKMNPL